MNQITSDILDFIILYESPISLFYTLSLIYIFLYHGHDLSFSVSKSYTFVY